MLEVQVGPAAQSESRTALKTIGAPARVGDREQDQGDEVAGVSHIFLTD